MSTAVDYLNQKIDEWLTHILKTISPEFEKIVEECDRKAIKIEPTLFRKKITTLTELPDIKIYRVDCSKEFNTVYAEEFIVLYKGELYARKFFRV